MKIRTWHGVALVVFFTTLGALNIGDVLAGLPDWVHIVIYFVSTFGAVAGMLVIRERWLKNSDDS